MNIGIAAPFTITEFLSYLDAPSASIAQSIPGMKAPAVDSLVYQLLRMGNNVSIFTLDPSVSECIRLNGEKLKIFVGPYRNPKWWHYFTAYFFRSGIVKRLVQMDDTKLDILHAHWTREYALGASYFRKNIPVVVTVRDWQPELLKSSKFNIGYIMLWLMDWQVFHTSNLFITANSKYIASKIQKRWGFNPFVLQNSISEEFLYTPSERKHCESDFLKIVTISNGINPNKNIECLIRGFNISYRKNKKLELLLVGADFVESNSIVQRWKKEGLLEGCVLCGNIAHKKLISFLDSTDVLFHPSLNESFGNILLEGLARKNYVIGGEHSGAVPYVLGFGEFGGLCDVKDVNAISYAIDEAYNNRLLNHSKAEERYVYVCETFSPSRIAGITVDYYNQVRSQF